MNTIQTVNVTTKEGHTLQLFYNAETNLVVLDLIHKNEQGGNELLRRTLDIGKALAHCQSVSYWA